MAKTRIMVVEDERIVALNLKQRLMKLGYEVSALVNSGPQALQEIERSPPDIVLMDIHTDGDFDGIETAARIPDTHQIPVIYLTAFSEAATLERARGTTPYGYLLKPFSERELHAAIQMALERRRVELLLRESEQRLEAMVAARTAELVSANRQLQQQIAERRKVEAAFAEAQKMEAIGRLTGGVAHDFNNLLTVVGCCLELIQLAGGDGARVERLAANAREGVERCERLIKQMLVFAGQQVMHPQIADPNRLIVEFETRISRIAGEAVDLSMRLTPSAHRTRIDVTQFERAIVNLVMNARDAIAGTGKITVATQTIEPGAGFAVGHPGVAPGSYVVVTVADSGPGIAPEILPKVFEPFFTTKGTGKGSGLGLSQVYGFVKESDGHVRIDSAPGRGTTVWLYLPSSLEAAPAVAALQPAAAAPVPAAVSGAVLVVEDDDQVRSLAVEGLRALGYEVLTAENAIRALEILQGETPVGILFSDIVMPGAINGVQLARTARQLRPGIKVLLTSGYAAASLGKHGLDQDVPILEKPYRLHELAAYFETAAGAA